MITAPRNTEFNEEQIAALEHLMATAKRKKFYAQLIANAYNNSFPCDLWTCARYTNGESDKRLITGLWLIVQLSTRGIESHEYYGTEAVEQLIKDWELRDAKNA